MSYEREVETVVDDDAPESDPRPSFGPLRVVTVTDGETIDEYTGPLPISACKSIAARRKVAV